MRPDGPCGSCPHDTRGGRRDRDVRRRHRVVPCRGRETAVAPTGAGDSPTIRDVHPGQSIAAAVDEAAPGDIVLIHDGTYPLQTIESQKADIVVVRGTSRTDVHVSGFVLSGATNLTFEDLSIDGPIEGGAGKGAMWIKDASSEITLSRRRHRSGVALGDDSTAGVVVASRSHDVTIKDSSITGARARGGNGRNVLIFGGIDPQADGDWVHDIMISGERHVWRRRPTTSRSRVPTTSRSRTTRMRGVQNNSDHNDGVQSVSSDHLTITANTITDDDGSYDEGIVLQSGIVAGGCLPRRGHRTPSSPTTSSVTLGEAESTWPAPSTRRSWPTPCTTTATALEDGVAKPGFGLVLYGGTKDTIGCGVNVPQSENVRVWNNVFDSIYRHPADNGISFQTSNVIGDAANAQHGDVVADPQFVDHVAYELMATSPAVDFGVTVAGTPIDDLHGRPGEDRPDVGALEIEAAAPPAPDSATDTVPEATQVPNSTQEPNATEVPTTRVAQATDSSWGVAAGVTAAVLVAGSAAVLVSVRRRRRGGLSTGAVGGRVRPRTSPQRLNGGRPVRTDRDLACGRAWGSGVKPGGGRAPRRNGVPSPSLVTDWRWKSRGSESSRGRPAR